MNEFSIYHIFRLIIKNLFIILLSAVIFAAAAFCYCEFKLESRYSATGSVIVTNGGLLKESETAANTQYDTNRVSGGDLSTSASLINTVRDLLLTQDDIYQELSKKLDGKYSAGQLKSFVSISKHEDYSLFLDVTFELNDQEDATRITNMFLELIPDCVDNIIPNTLTSIISASKGAYKTYPRTARTTAIAFIVGAVFAFAIVFIISLFNTTIKSEEDFKERYNIPVLGDIPDFASAKSGKYGKSYYKGGNYYGRY